MTIYRARLNESPSMIARRFGVPMSALIAANPHKPTTRVGNVTTWRGLQHNESVRLPAGAVGSLGDFLGVTPSSPSAPHVQISRGSGAAADVALWQTIIGVTPDGGFGPNTEAATKKWQSAHGLTPDGIVGPRSWAAALGSSAGPVAPAPTASATPTAPPSGLSAAARAAAAALSADSNYCASVRRVGTAVNTAVHNFKAAWNAANPSRPVPIGTGNYESVVASALSETLGGATVPPGCGAAAAPAPTAAATPAAAPAATQAARAGAPAAVMALLAIDPCAQANASIVTAAQKALGISNADGKYGSETASAARRLVSNAPAACSPRPAWWAPPGTSNASSGASQAATAAQSAANTAQAAATAAQNATTAVAATQAATAAAAAATAAQTAAAEATPDQKPAADAAAATAATAAKTADAAAQAAGGGSAITPPEGPKKLSTGAIIAGAVGVAALVGVAAMALGGKKGHRRASGGGRRKPSKRKASHGKRKSKSKKRK